MLLSFNDKNKNGFRDKQLNTTTVDFKLTNPTASSFYMTYAEIDAQVDALIPPNRIYTKYEALQIRDNLKSQLMQNPTSLVINWALVRFYTLSPVYAGGGIGLALQEASYVYSINSYLGCLAYEFIYTRTGLYDQAKRWYKRSLINPLPSTMVWEEISYHQTPQQNVKVIGSFNNYKSQMLYEDIYGVYKRRVMRVKGDQTPSKLIVDYRNFNVGTKSEFIVSVF